MTVEEMDTFVLLRWSALIDGVNMIYDKAEECDLDIENINLKQNHLIKYIDESSERVKVV